MDIVTILRKLWQRRLLVGLVALVASVVGFMLAYQVSFPPKSRSYKVGVATARVLVDTPKSQVVEVAPKGSETLGPRASLLANLMVDGKVKADIAHRAGLRPGQLLASAQSGTEAQAIEPSATGDRKAYILTTGVVYSADLGELPIIKVDAQAPDARQASELANAAVTGLGDHLDSKAADEEVSDRRRLRVSGLGRAQASEVVRGPSAMIAFGAAIFIFLGGCAAIIVASALARGWRQAGALEQADLSDLGPNDSSTLDDLFADRRLDAFRPKGNAEIVKDEGRLKSA